MIPGFNNSMTDRPQLAPQQTFGGMSVCAVQVIAPLLRVLVALHRQHILHRDIKPENLFLTRKRAVVLGDFGLAIRCDEELPFTRSGTLDYMAPEVRIELPLHDNSLPAPQSQWQGSG